MRKYAPIDQPISFIDGVVKCPICKSVKTKTTVVAEKDMLFKCKSGHHFLIRHKTIGATSTFKMYYF